MRALGTIFGVISIILGVFVLFTPDVARFTLILLLSVGLLFEGLRRISLGFRQKALSKKIRGLRIGIGGVIVLLSLIVMIMPGIGLQALIIMLALALFMQGLWRISHGLVVNKLSVSVRTAYIVVGFITLIFSGLALLNPGLAELTLVLLLAFVLLMNGIGSVLHGIFGIKKGL